MAPTFDEDVANNPTLSIFPSLPADGPTRSRSRLRRSAPIPVHEVPGLGSFCETRGIAPTNLLQLTWAVLLRSYTGADCVAFGFRECGPEEGTDKIYCVNFRTANSLALLLQRSNTIALPKTDLSQLDYNTFLLLLPPDQADESCPDLAVDDGKVRMNGKAPQFDITLAFQLGRKEALRGTLHYASNKLSDVQASHVACAFAHIAGAIIASPAGNVSDLDLISTRDLEQLKAWNCAPPARQDHCVHQLIAKRCLGEPESLAIASWDGDVTYRELHARSSCLAEYLFSVGVSTGEVVPLLFEKSKWAIIAMLAVIKTGAAFVFLDPSYPKERLQTIAQDVNATFVVASSEQSDLASSITSRLILVSDSQEYWTHATKSDWRNPASQPGDVLYLVFTSGSTGRAKGVLIEHAAFATRALIAGPALRMHLKARVLQFSSYAFAASYRDILTTLIWGGCLCVPSETSRKNELPSFIASYGVTWACLTPAVIKTLSPEKLPSLTTLVVGGEQMTQAVLDTWVDKVHLMAGYGLSEGAGINILQEHFGPEMDCHNIGHGLATTTWLVDVEDHNKLAPIGAVGEIVLEGPAMSRGYINHPEKSRESFLTSALWLRKLRGVDHSQLYRTGDLGRYNAIDGTIIYLGRRDTQIKVNGQLVDLREIELQLQKCFSTTAASAANLAVEVITPKGDRMPRIVACIEATGDDSSIDGLLGNPRSVPQSWRSLGSQLDQSLPRFMLPFAFVPILRMPMTASDKQARKTIRDVLERLTLKDLQDYGQAEEAYEQPCGELETKLHSLWAIALNQDADMIGRHSHLFRLGGDSVTAIVLVGLARDAGLYLTVDGIFEHPVLCDQAQSCTTLDLDVNVDGYSVTSAECPPYSLLDEESRETVLSKAAEQCDVAVSQLEDVYPCTALQEGMMALTMRSSQAYVSQHVYRLKENHDPKSYKKAWQSVIEVNPILRTRIVQTKQGVLQVVVKSSQLISQTRLRLHQYLADDKTDVMEVGGALFRIAMVYDDANKPYCVISAHHSLYDLWSMRLLIDQVEDACLGLSLTQRPFAPFVRHVLKAQNSSADFWTAKLQGCSAPVFPLLPSAQYTPLPNTLTEQVEIPCGLGSFEHITLSNQARLAWALTISHYTGSHEATFGAVVSGRGVSLPGVDKMTGPTIATVPVRIQLSSFQTVRDALSEIQLDSRRQIPYEQMGLLQISKLSSDACSACQFQSLLVVQAKDSGRSSDFMERTNVGDMDRLAAFGTYAMTVLFQIQAEGKSVLVRILYDDQVISPTQTQRILSHFADVLADLPSRLDTPLSSMPTIGANDMAELKASNGDLPGPVDRCLQDIIMETADSQPSAEAVSAWDGAFNYFELLRRSKHLARRLRAEGVRRPGIVPICMTKSKHVPVAILAVIFAGATFTLLDPAYPLARIRTVLAQINASVMLSNVPELADRLDDPTIKILALDDACLSDLPDSTAVPYPSPSPNDCLYVAWTSGSTGNPKGAMVTHASYASAATAYKNPYGLKSSSRVLQLASLAFDASVLEILTTLMVGGCICIPSEHSIKNELAESIGKMRVNWMLSTPTVARLLRQKDVPSLKTIVLGGEPITRADICSWQGYCDLVIAYGPAECSVCSSYLKNPQPQDANSIGFPVGTVFWVVDPTDHDRLMPIGSVGELLIEGNNVGMGYLNDHERTRAAFIDSPKWLLEFRNGTSTPLYKTGDLVQYREDNSFRFVGRKDAQVKFHGQRLELGEVEGLVRDAMSNTRQTLPREAETVIVELVHPPANDGRPVLVTFILVDSIADTADTPAACLMDPFPAFMEMCQAIRSKLFTIAPRHLVPGLFIPLATLPRTYSHKTDRKALRNLCASLSVKQWRAYARSHAQEARPPSTDNEHVLHDLLKDILAVDDIDMASNFLDLGGDSIVAMRLSRAALDAGHIITVADILSYPRLVEMASKLAVSRRKVQIIPPPFSLTKPAEHHSLLTRATEECQVSAGRIEDIYSSTAFQEDLILLTIDTPGAYITSIRHSVPAEVDISLWRMAWTATFDANPILRTRLFQKGTETFQVVIRDEITWNSSEIVSDSQPSHMGFGTPLSHFTIIKQPDTVEISLTIHHSLYDGWSLPLILQQVEMAYHGYELQMRPFSPFMEHLATQDIASVKDYWRDKLRGYDRAPFPALSTSKRIPNPISTMNCTIPVKPLSHTRASAVKLAWAIAVSKCTRSNDVVFGVVASGRDVPIPGIDEITGPTVTEYPFRISFAPEKPLAELLEEVEHQSYKDTEYQQFGLRNIRKVSSDAAAACAFQNLLVIQPEKQPLTKTALVTRISRQNVKQAFETLSLCVTCYLSETSIRTHLDFDESLLPRAQAAEILAHFREVLESL